jgi:hypothetical protein
MFVFCMVDLLLLTLRYRSRLKLSGGSPLKFQESDVLQAVPFLHSDRISLKAFLRQIIAGYLFIQVVLRGRASMSFMAGVG